MRHALFCACRKDTCADQLEFAGANFEYGSLTWEPVTGIEPYRDPLHGGFAVVDDAGQAAVPVINNTWAPDQGDSLNQWAVEFTLKTHWQLDEALDVGAPLAQLDRDGVVLANLTDAPSVAQVTDWLTSVSGGSYRIRIAPRVKDSEDISSFLVSRKDEDDYYPAVGFEYDAQTHLAMLAAADKTHVRGPQCIAPADDGDSPACGVSHTYAATSGGTLTSSRGLAAIGPCQGRDIKMTRDEYGSHIVDAAASPFFPVGCCDVDTTPDYCVPAAAISGFFPGCVPALAPTTSAMSRLELTLALLVAADMAQCAPPGAHDPIRANNVTTALALQRWHVPGR